MIIFLEYHCFSLIIYGGKITLRRLDYINLFCVKLLIINVIQIDDIENSANGYHEI